MAWRKMLAGLLLGCGILPLSAAETAPAAPVALHGVFTSNMVLQRGRPIVFSGTAAAGTEVSVEFAGRTVTATAGADGEWRAEFPAMEADGRQYSVKVSARALSEPLILGNMVVGDVWICSGQSNMEMPVGGNRPFFRAANYAEEVANAVHPDLRLFNASAKKYVSPGKVQTEPVGVGWDVCSPESVAAFSACGYFFGRDLQQELKIPVGLVNAAWSGTMIQPWISYDAYKAAGRPEAKNIEAATSGDAVALLKKQEAEYAAACADWLEKFMASAPEATAAAQAWKTPDFDDSGWTALAAAPLMMDGDVDGVAWFRKTVEIPDALAGKDMLLTLGAVDDYDETFFNGVKVGATGADVKNHWEAPRAYVMPGSLVKAGKNVIAVRAIDTRGGGGLTGPAENMALAPKDAPDAKILLSRDWRTRVEFAVDKAKLPAEPKQPQNINSPSFPATLYNSLIAPWLRVPVCGVIWYQGCSNSWAPEDYYNLLPMMIRDWREKWRSPEMPFLLVQLAGYGIHSPDNRQPDDFWTKQKPESDGFIEIREVQAEMLKLPMVGMAVAIDVGDHSDIHPRDKQTLGKRLLAEYRRLVQKADIASPGPMFKGMKIDGGKIRVEFTNVGGGLTTKDGKKPGAFAIAGADGKYVWAQAEIDGDGVVVWADGVKEPKNVRYAWARFRGDVNLCNREGFPAVPFRSDKPERKALTAK